MQRVVDLVVDHARSGSSDSLGVITFGIPHTRRIEAALEAAYRLDPELEGSLNQNPREPFFVKNIERVQGDERDNIILSVGYGKNAAGQLKLFWGPLLKAGGERRLNVAISRAKSKLTLVTSFGADEVRDDAHHSVGFALMYRFLRFMASNGTELAGGSNRALALNPFEIDVRDRLTAAGLDLAPQFGVGSYRLDFAVRHPKYPGRFIMAIEADGANYHSGHLARERDRLRQRLLEARGWRFHRIWSTDWFNDCESQVAAAVAAYEEALDEHDSKSSAVDEPVTAAAAWQVSTAQRRLPRPRLQPGQTIDKYQRAELVALVRYVRSDDVLRTRHEELQVLIAELGFKRGGTRIVAALTAAQDG